MEQYIALIEKQKELDNVIREKRNLQGVNLIEEKTAAMIIELGEMANELPEHFKHWSSKRNNYKKALEEYVDALHLLLSLGVETGLEPRGDVRPWILGKVVSMFNDVIKEVGKFRKEPSREQYEYLFYGFICLGKSLGFENDRIIEEYNIKNKINHLRQQQGY